MPESQRADLAFVLSAFARTTKVNLYQEHFPQYRRARGGGSLPTLKGTLPQLINAICLTWGYRVEKMGKDYLFWSRDWAMDRQADISEKNLDRWQRRFPGEAAGGPDALTQAALEFTWPQMKYTLGAAIPEVGAKTDHWAKRTYASHRVVGLMSLQERQAALEESGIPISRLSARARTELLNAELPELKLGPLRSAYIRLYRRADTNAIDPARFAIR